MAVSLPAPAGGVVRLANGVEMPSLGLGTFQASGLHVREAVKFAIHSGYSHIDTASIYRNEEEIARAIAESGVKRESLFITSKVSPYEQGYEATLEAFERTTGKLQTSYLDLYLIHWPGVSRLDVKSPQNAVTRAQTWKALESLYQQGKCRAIGVSNFMPKHLESLMAECRVAPMVNQVELHPWLSQLNLRQFCRRHSIHIVAYSSLARGELIGDAVVKAIAEKRGCSPAQALLAWGLHHGIGVIPKSVKAQRIEENAGCVNVILTEEDMATLDGMNKDYHTCWNPNSVA